MTHPDSPQEREREESEQPELGVKCQFCDHWVRIDRDAFIGANHPASCICFLCKPPAHPDSPQEREQIGWQLVPIYRDDSDGFFVVTQACIHCCSCGKAISGTGGPMTNAYCMDCLKDITPIGYEEARRFYDEWPGGLDEIEASVRGWNQRDKEQEARIAALEAQLSASQAELAAVREDAERYRWLRKKTMRDVGHTLMDLGAQIGVRNFPPDFLSLDAAIDAERARRETE